ncbi:MAG: MlaD family protein [Planctomycetota bacterium]
MTAAGIPSLPAARVAPVRGWSWSWLLPIAALLFVGWVIAGALGGRGLLLTVHAPDGHGLRAGDALRYRGIRVGEVERLRLAADLQEVLLEVRLAPGAEALARQGSGFWIVRPHVTLDSVQGLETIFGARYLAVRPGPAGGERRIDFDALAEPPVEERIEPGGLEITLEVAERGGLSPGAPVLYRSLQVGSVLAVGLAGDAAAVEVRAYVRPAYAPLVRRDSVFWEAGGVELRLGLVGGLDVELDSLRSLVVGGVAFATPTDPGPPAGNGQRFPLRLEPPEEVAEWRPSIAVGSELLPPGAARPVPVRASLTWREGLVWRSRKGRVGWVLPVPGGFLGPADLLRAPPDARRDSAALEIAGGSFPPGGALAWEEAGVGRLEASLGERLVPWRGEAGRPLAEPEECLVLADAGTPPLALSAARLVRDGDAWRVDGALAIDEDWHGACVVARRDGALLGFLLVAEDGPRIGPAGPR